MNKGTIYFDDKHKKWIGEISLGMVNGRKKMKKFSSKFKSELESKMKSFKNTMELKSSDIFFAQSITFTEYAELWLSEQRHNLKPSSYQRKEQTYTFQVKPYFEYFNMKDISYADIKNFIIKLSDDGLSYSTIRKSYEFLNGITREYRIQYGVPSYNPCEGIKLPVQLKKEKRESIKFYTDDEMNRINNEATRKYSNGNDVYRLGYAIILLMYTGLRIGELLALKWDDIDFEGKKISITKNSQYLKVDNKYQMVDQISPKTVSGVRTVPLVDRAFEALKYIYIINGDCKYIMSTKNKCRITPRNVDRTFRDICRVANVPLNGVHSLRHSYASLLFKNGCDVQIVSRLLGHSSPSITRDIYIHLIEEQEQKAVEDVNKYINGNSEGI